MTSQIDPASRVYFADTEVMLTGKEYDAASHSQRTGPSSSPWSFCQSSSKNFQCTHLERAFPQVKGRIHISTIC